jgi:hypothetical protein
VFLLSLLNLFFCVTLVLFFRILFPSSTPFRTSEQPSPFLRHPLHPNHSRVHTFKPHTACITDNHLPFSPFSHSCLSSPSLPTSYSLPSLFLATTRFVPFFHSGHPTLFGSPLLPLPILDQSTLLFTGNYPLHSWYSVQTSNSVVLRQPCLNYSSSLSQHHALLHICQYQTFVYAPTWSVRRSVHCMFCTSHVRRSRRSMIILSRSPFSHCLFSVQIFPCQFLFFLIESYGHPFPTAIHACLTYTIVIIPYCFLVSYITMSSRRSVAAYGSHAAM